MSFVYYTIKGTDFKVSPSGATINGSRCPLDLMSSEQLIAARKAANGSVKDGVVEKDSAIHAIGPHGEVQYLTVCRNYFDRKARLANPQEPDPVVACAYRPPAERETCEGDMKIAGGAVSDYGGVQYVKNNVLPQTGTAGNNSMSREQADAIAKKRKEEEDARNQCFNGTLERISQYWTKQRGVECVKVAKRYITKNIKKQIKEELNHMESVQAQNLQFPGQGSSPGAILSLPSIPGVVKSMLTLAKYAVAVAKVASDNASDLDFLLNKCLGLSDKLKELQTWKKGVLNGLCKQVESLVERQLTQCIRVNVGFDLALPQFSVMLQCPIVINANAYIGPSGARFDWSCIKQNPASASGSWMGLTGSASASGTSSASWGGQSLLSSSGGLENLFNGNCFQGSTNSSGNGNTGTDRIPGVDCGPLDMNSPVRQERLTGETLLAAGPVVANGWSVGGTEKNLISPAGHETDITRCDFYRNSVRERTVYVYGSGASCNTGTNGFLENGFETNTACYTTGGYLARTEGDSIPDACMYPPDCLDTTFSFSEARRGVDSCPSNVQPQLDPARRYRILSGTGGVGGGGEEWRNCSDFNRDAEQAPVCCDPQTQDCRKAKEKNIPICACDQGDSANRVIDPATGKCEQGGTRTCCTASLNGGVEGCTSQVGMPSSQICANGDQCLKSSEVAGTDMSGRPITAGQANTAKPSPFAYLVIRPDVTLDSITNTDGTPKQCCTTPWCNICPQHYANAYGMAMARAEWSLSRPSESASDASVMNYNNAILGKGWPFTTSTNAQGETLYTIGLNPITLSYTKAVTVPGALGIGTSTKEEDYDAPMQYPMLHMSDKMENKPSSAMMDTCNTKLGQWKIGYTSADNFGQGNTNALGFVYDSYYDWPRNRKDVWKVVAPLPEPREMPLDYLNRLQSGKVNPNGIPAEPIELCSDVVKVCTPGSNNLPTPTGGVGAPTMTSGTVTPPPAVPQTPSTGGVGAPVTQPTGGTNSQSPVASGGGGGGAAPQQAPSTNRVAPTRAPTAVTPGATTVPSASGGGGSRGLY